MSELTPPEIAERGLIIRLLIAHSACDGPDLCGENAPIRSGQ